MQLRIKRPITNPLLIQGLRADIVPHHQWALRRWFYRTSLWYYHAPSSQPQMSPSPRFYELVDPELKELCRTLNDHGIQTTPSCQGHFYKRSRFERIWSQLGADWHNVVRNGLQVRDSATGEAFLFRDAEFALPWSYFDEFHWEAGASQGHGYLGMIIPCHKPQLSNRLHDDRYQTSATWIEFDPFLTKRFQARVFAIEVSPESPLERRREWREVTEYVSSLLHHEYASEGPFRRNPDSFERVE